MNKLELRKTEEKERRTTTEERKKLGKEKFDRKMKKKTRKNE